MESFPLDLAVSKNKVTILGNGLVGSAIAETFTDNDFEVRSLGSKDLDLLDSAETNKFISKVGKDEVLIFAAGLSGGISFNLENPYELFSKNLGMINNFISAAANNKIEKVINIVPACVYPANLKERARVEDLWQGPMEKSSLAYSTAKMAGLVGIESVRKQLGLNWSNLIVTNVYGPHKKIHSKQMHVIPALIEKIKLAKSNGDKLVQILGDGTPVREFLYSSDLGDAVKSFIENDLWGIPTLNIAGSEAISILELAKLIANELAYEGEILVEKGSNNGTSIKLLDDSIFRKSGWVPKVQLKSGIKLIQSYQ
jgi:GDP-L-fucose synthase